MRAYLYAAGRGIRLGTDYAELPKILIDVRGKTVLEWHAIRLARQNITEIFVITGYKRELIEKVIAGIRFRYGIAIQEIRNEDFNEGSVISFHRSLTSIFNGRDSVLLMDGDVVYPDIFLQKLIESPSPSALLIDQQYSVEDDDPVLVPIRDNVPFEFQKCWEGEAEKIGESIGFFKVDPLHFPALNEEVAMRLEGAARMESYDEVLRGLVRRGCFGFEDVSGLPWTELDFPKDVDYARNEVQPQIEELESNPSKSQKEI